MQLRSLLLGSAALAGLGGIAFSPEGLGGDGVASVPTYQSYDPTGTNYVPANLVDAVRAGGSIVLTEVPAPIVAQVATSAVAEPVALISSDLTDADRITALEARVAVLESTPNSKANDVLAWAEKVLTKYYNGETDRPTVDGNFGPIGG